MKLDEFLDFFDFSYEKYDDGYGLIDNQKANLGDIESERFSKPSDLVERINGSIYVDDYITHDLEDEFGYNGDYSREDMYNFARKNNLGYADILYVMCYPDTVTI